MAKQQNAQKLNVPKTILTGFGFLATSIAWAIYDPYITKILNKILSESEFVTESQTSVLGFLPLGVHTFCDLSHMHCLCAQ